MQHSLKKSADAGAIKEMSSAVHVPLFSQKRKDKHLTCSTTGYPLHYKCREGLDSHPSKTLFIQYHPAIPQYISGKTCVANHHGNSGPCYLCHHGNMITPTNGCITYAPIQVPPRYNGMCFCLLCQQRAASLSCNCQSCLSLRFEHTAASVLRPTDKELSIKSAVCCNGVTCESIPVNRPQYPQYCHCVECVNRISKDSRLKNSVQVLHRHETVRTDVLPQHDKDPNNNESSNEQNESTDIKTDVREQLQRCNEDKNPTGKDLPDKEHGISCGEIQNRKRKSEDDHLFVCKIIKTENIEGTCKLESEDEIVSVVQDDEDNRINEQLSSPVEERENQWNSGNTDSDEHIIEDSDSSTSSSPGKYYKEEYDYEDSSTSVQNNHHDNITESHSDREHRHYNTRLTSTKTRSYDKDYQGSSKLKKDKELYGNITKSISRQRTKLNRLLANEHERRRVAQLNSAYQDLRQLIPGYQCDTKLPKIKILRYAINYIAHLDDVLEMDNEKEGV